jgi:signal transduction histidine kinase
LGGDADRLIGTRAPWPIQLGADRLATHLGGRDYTYSVTELGSTSRHRILAVQFRDVTAERRREQQLRAFSVAATNLAFADTLSAALDRLAEHVRRIAGMASCTFLLYGPQGSLRQAGASGRYPHHPDYLEKLIESREQGAPLISDEVMRTRRPEIAHGWHERMLTDPRFAPMRSFTEKSDWDTIVVIPLLSRGEAVGVFNGFYREGTAPADNDLRFLQSIADHAAIAIDMFALREQVQRDAVRAERGKLARDLHDSVSQMLFSLNLQAAAAEASSSDPLLGKSLHQIRELSSEAFAVMRQMILGTRPLDAQGELEITGALRQHVAALIDHTGMMVDLKLPEELVDLDGEVREQVLRVVQEALHNVVRHAPGSHVVVRVTRDESRSELRVEVSDDGGGFDAGAPRPGRLGLTGMAERIREIGGRFSIESTSGGTTVSATVPLARPQPKERQ